MLNSLSTITNKYFLFISCIIVTLALGLRLLSLNPFGIWFDEQCSLRGSMGQIFDPGYEVDNITPETIQSSAQPPQHHFKSFLPSDFHNSNVLNNVIPAMMGTDRGNGPLHYFQGYFWIKLFGQYDVSVRLNSVFYSTLTLIALLFLISRFFSPSLALMSGALYAVHPIVVKYAVQFRPYSMASFFTVLSTFAILNIVTEARKGNFKSSYYLLYFVTAASLFFTHYLTSYIIFGHILFCIISLRSRVAWLKLIACGFGVLILFIIWLNLGAADAIKVMSAHSELWAQRKLADGGFTVLELLRELKFLLLKLFYIQSSFDYTDLNFFNLKHFYRLIKTVASLFTIVTIVYFFRNRIKNDLKWNLLLSVIIGCVIYGVASSIKSQHYLPFVDRYNVFAYTISGITFSYIVYKLYQRAKKTWFKKILIGVFCSQWLICFTNVLINSHKNESYVWKNKNIFVSAANKIMSFDPTQYEVLYPTWNITTMTNLYISKDFKITQNFRQNDDNKKIIYMIDTLTKNKIPITDHIEE